MKFTDYDTQQAYNDNVIAPQMADLLSYVVLGKQQKQWCVCGHDQMMHSPKCGLCGCAEFRREQI